MSPNSANIRSPDVLRRFRHRYFEFDETIRSALELVTRDLSAVTEWLHREQQPYWRRRVRVLDDKLKKARREYITARYGDRRMGKPSCIDERKAFERAQREHQQAEKKAAVVDRWMLNLEHKSDKLRAPVKRLEILLDTLTPKALARLDFMMDRLDEYMQAPRTRSAGDAGGTQEGENAPDQSA